MGEADRPAAAQLAVPGAVGHCHRCVVAVLLPRAAVGAGEQVVPVDKLSVVLAVVFGLVFMGEKPSLSLLIGGVLIVAGAVVIALF